MSPTTATTTVPASSDAGTAAEIAAERPTYRYAGEGRFLPANEQAREECRRFNAWVEEVNARASRSA